MSRICARECESMSTLGERVLLQAPTGKKNTDLEIVLNGMSNKNAILDEFSYRALDLFEGLC